ncbi:hypothetical protein GQ457_07G016440 [Hibiscus cannabinus]
MYICYNPLTIALLCMVLLANSISAATPPSLPESEDKVLFRWKFKVHVMNGMPDNVNPVRAACRSNDEFLGCHIITQGQEFRFEFRTSLFRKTRFICYLWWRDQHMADITVFNDSVEGRSFLRNHHGEWIVGFSKSIWFCSTIEAELWGIYECLKYAWELGIDRLWLESDCGSVIQVLKDREVRHSISIIHYIWDLLDKQWEVHLLVISRDSNKVADSLAHLAWNLPFGFHDFIDPPSSISSLVLADVP